MQDHTTLVRMILNYTSPKANKKGKKNKIKYINIKVTVKADQIFL